jgi:hypothetical protein
VGRRRRTRRLDVERGRADFVDRSPRTFERFFEELRGLLHDRALFGRRHLGFRVRLREHRIDGTRRLRSRFARGR